MLCEKCKKNDAVIFYREIVNGREKKYALCEKCKEELKRSGEIKIKDITDGFFSDFGDPFASVFGGFFASPAMIATKSEIGVKKCPVCHTTQREVRRDGKLGCPECYEVFKEELESAFGKGFFSRGDGKEYKIPSSHREKAKTEERIASLNEAMRAAIAEENFEEAARLRDEIRGIKDQTGK